jgi:hypothetical protein
MVFPRSKSIKENVNVDIFLKRMTNGNFKFHMDIPVDAKNLTLIDEKTGHYINFYIFKQIFLNDHVKIEGILDDAIILDWKNFKPKVSLSYD